MFYENYYWGMTFVWWVVWVGIVGWIFTIPYDIPFQRRRKESPLELLQRRFASGIISVEEYNNEKREL
jgi:putative membrane protein